MTIFISLFLWLHKQINKTTNDVNYTQFFLSYSFILVHKYCNYILWFNTIFVYLYYIILLNRGLYCMIKIISFKIYFLLSVTFVASCSITFVSIILFDLLNSLHLTVHNNSSDLLQALISKCLGSIMVNSNGCLVRSIDFILQQRLTSKHGGKKASKSIRQKWSLSGNLFWQTLWKSEVKLYTPYLRRYSGLLLW